MLLSRQVLLVIVFSLPTGGGRATAASQASLFTASDIYTLEHWLLTEDGSVLGKTPDGEPINVGVPDAALLDVPGAQQFAPSFPQVRLRNGEVLGGDAIPREATDEIVVATELFGTLAFRPEEILEVRYSGIRPEPVPAPCVVLSNGDVVAGKIVAIKRDRVVVDSVFGETPLDRRVVGRLVFASESALTDGRREGQSLLVLSDGRRVHADRVYGESGSDQIHVTRAGKDGRVPETKVERLVFPGWKWEYLSGLPYEVVEAVPYFDGPVEVRKDRNAAGGPLWLGSRWFEHGFGTRPRSRVRVELNGKWTFLSGWVGLDDHLGKMGNASTALVADGKIAYASDEMTGGGKPDRLLINLAEVEELEVVTDFGLRGHIGDFVNWCDMLLVGRR